MIEVDTLAQAIDESQCSGPVGLEDMSWSLSTASKALVDIAISLRTLAGRPLPETTPRQEKVAQLLDQGITDRRELIQEIGGSDGDYLSEVMRRVLSDGLSDPDPSPSADKPGKHADGAKEEQTKANEEEA